MSELVAEIQSLSVAETGSRVERDSTSPIAELEEQSDDVAATRTRTTTPTIIEATHTGVDSDDDADDETEALNDHEHGSEEQIMYADEALAVEKSIETSMRAKEEGNEHFRSRRFDEAIDSYSMSIDHCPLDETNKSNLATFYGNRAAAYFAVEEYDLVIEDCTSALELNPEYFKVLLRRQLTYEKIDRIDEALVDAKRMQELNPAFPNISVKVRALQAEHDKRLEKMKDEALGKLKDLGNSILSNFGMSLDNFKMNQDPATGSWNISMGNK